MKKVFVLIAAAIVCMSASAQFQFGAKVGFDMTHFWGEDAPTGVQPNYQVGLMMEYKFTPKFAIAPEVVFAAQGGKASEDFDDDDIPGIPGTVKANGTFHTNYINVPVMLKFYATPNFSIDLGPQVGFNVYNKMTASGKIASIEAKETIDLKDITKTVDFGVGLGATYNLTNNAFVQARYTLGLTNVFDVNDSHEKNGNAQIAFGMKF
ncbi:MAG: PorT family protein [Muribaculaceae bacterium]|nr:PorT family protein [Muribaculaceae bacterium]